MSCARCGRAFTQPYIVAFVPINGMMVPTCVNERECAERVRLDGEREAWE